MDVLDLLIADHNRVRGLIARYNEADETDNETHAAELARQITAELKVHMAAEEDVFYRSVKERSEEIGEEVDEGYQEHHVAKLLLGEIEDLEAGTDEWVAKMTVLIESTEHHLDEEEEELFPSVRSKSTAAWRNDLGVELDTVETELGATPLADKLKFSTEELHERAGHQKIPGRSSMKHDELAATVGGDTA